MARVLLLEIVPVDRLQRPISFPFLQGALNAAAVPVRRMRFAVPASARAVSGTQGFVFGPAEEESVRRVLKEFTPTHVIVGPEPSSSLLRIVESTEPRPAVMPFALQIAEGQIPLVPLGLRPSLQGIEGFEHFLGMALRKPGEEHLNVYEIATPDFAWEPGNKAAEEAWSLPYLVTGEACAYHKGLSRNPVFKGIDTSGAARLDGCTFCVRPAVEEEWHHEPAELMGRQLEALALTHRKQPGRLAVRILGDAFLLNVEAFAKTVKGLALPPCDFLLDGRSDVLVAQRPALENALHEMEGLPHTLNISLVGVENFDPDELVRMNKGAGWKVNLELIRMLLELENRHPTRFIVRKHAPLSLILFTPWTRLQDLALNVAILRQGRIESLFNKIFTSRMRLYRTLPIHALAAKDGLLTDHYADALFDTARENFYSDEIPWRFADPRVEAVNSLFLRLTDRTDRERDALGRAVDELRVTDRLALAAAVIDAAQLSTEPLDAVTLLARSVALIAPDAAPPTTGFTDALVLPDGSSLEIVPSGPSGPRFHFRAGRSEGTHPLLPWMAQADEISVEPHQILLLREGRVHLALGARAFLTRGGQPTQPELWEKLIAIRAAVDAAPVRPAPHVSREHRPRVGPEAILLAKRFSDALHWTPESTLGDFRLEAIQPDRDDEVIFRFSSASGTLELHVSPLLPGRGAYLKAGAFAIAHAKDTPIDSKPKDEVARRLGAALEPLSAASG